MWHGLLIAAMGAAGRPSAPVLPQDSNTLLAETDVPLSSLDPPGGPVKGGTTVTISGKGFDSLSKVHTPDCFFGTERSPAHVLSDFTLICIAAPAVGSQAGAVQVSVSVNSDSPTASQAAASLTYTYYDDPSITSMTPSAGHLKGGQKAIIKGSGLDKLPGGTAKCRFGSTQVPVTAMAEGGKQVACTVPAAAEAGSVPLSVSLNGVDFTNPKSGAVLFDYIPGPAKPLPLPPPPPLPNATNKTNKTNQSNITVPKQTLKPRRVFIPGQTVLAEFHKAGVKRLVVESTLGFKTGYMLLINPGGETEEIAMLEGKGSLVVAAPTQFEHMPGERVIQTVEGVKGLPPSDLATYLCVAVIIGGAFGVLILAICNRRKGKTGMQMFE